MANNTVLNSGSGGDTLQTVDHSGVKTPVSHIADPTTQTQMVAVSAAGALKVDGSAVTQPVSDAGGSLTVDNTALTSIDAKVPALGQALAAASVPVVLTAAQITTLTPPAAITGFALDATVTTTNTEIGGLTETAPASDTASSGLNGRLQRIAQRITSLITALGSPFQAGGALGAGTAIIGKVTTDQTTHGTTDLVAADITKLGGTAVDTNSGNKSAGTLRVVLATDQPALTNKLLVTPDANSAVNATAEGAQISNSGTQLTPKYAVITASSSGATTIVAAVTSKKIRVIALKLVANAAVNVKWQSHVTPTDKTGLSYLAANGGEVLPANQWGWFETITGEALDINLSGAVAVGGHLTYVEV
jgi:hypothetical protein